MYLNPTLLCDFYKLSHREQYPEGTEVVYSTWTPRSGRHAPNVEKVVVFGVQGAIYELMRTFNKAFFEQPKFAITSEYKRVVHKSLGVENVDTSHIEDLHDLGYLPIKIKSLDEGTLVNFNTPILTIENTDPRFFWLTNYLETYLSALLWKPCTTATIANVYRMLLDTHGVETTDSIDHVDFQAHDFSMRGMSGVEDAARSGAGHLTSFLGTDTIPAILYAENYYRAKFDDDIVGCSVPATEHSVMCAGGKDNEFDTFKRLITELYPSGIVSIVSDTWDLWHVLTDTLPKLKEEILARDGKLVIRPDSGDPADIICGPLYQRVWENQPEEKGVVELLWDEFGGTVNEQGYKVLDPHVGVIYGDSITVERCKDICERLRIKGFASSNVVFGIGSYTYQHITRDTLGFAMKATSVRINGEDIAIFKDPVTDSGDKKSAYGRVRVFRRPNGLITWRDESDPIDPSKEQEYLLKTRFEDGETKSFVSFQEVRNRIKNERNINYRPKVT